MNFVAGDFMSLDLGSECFDLVASLEVLSHVEDQKAFLRRIAGLLRPGGQLMLATQNRPALERNTIPAPRPGQLRRWVDRQQLTNLLQLEYHVHELFSITPKFNRGPLRLVNSQKLRRLAEVSRLSGVLRMVVRIEERHWLGWTLMALASRRK